jgi:hypothetical protein
MVSNRLIAEKEGRKQQKRILERAVWSFSKKGSFFNSSSSDEDDVQKPRKKKKTAPAPANPQLETPQASDAATSDQGQPEPAPKLSVESEPKPFVFKRGPIRGPLKPITTFDHVQMKKAIFS